MGGSHLAQGTRNGGKQWEKQKNILGHVGWLHALSGSPGLASAAGPGWWQEGKWEVTCGLPAGQTELMPTLLLPPHTQRPGDGQ